MTSASPITLRRALDYGMAVSLNLHILSASDYVFDSEIATLYNKSGNELS